MENAPQMRGAFLLLTAVLNEASKLLDNPVVANARIGAYAMLVEHLPQLLPHFSVFIDNPLLIGIPSPIRQTIERAPATRALFRLHSFFHVIPLFNDVLIQRSVCTANRHER